MGFWGNLGNAMNRAALVVEWMEVDDTSRLRYVIRNDIRRFNAEDIGGMYEGLENQIRKERIRGEDTEKLARLITVYEIFSEEAERKTQSE